MKQQYTVIGAWFYGAGPQACAVIPGAVTNLTTVRGDLDNPNVAPYSLIVEAKDEADAAIVARETLLAD